MRVVANGTRFVTHVRVRFRLRDVRLFVAFETGFLRRQFQQTSLVGVMRIVAGVAFAIPSRIMLERSFLQLLLKIIVAFEAKFRVLFDRQLGELRRVRVVAREAFAIFHRRVFEFLGKIVVAFHARFLAQLLDHLRERRTVRIVARAAFPIFGGLMFELRFLEKIIMASEANVLLRRF